MNDGGGGVSAGLALAGVAATRAPAMIAGPLMSPAMTLNRRILIPLLSSGIR